LGCISLYAGAARSKQVNGIYLGIQFTVRRKTMRFQAFSKKLITRKRLNTHFTNTALLHNKASFDQLLGRSITSSPLNSLVKLRGFALNHYYFIFGLTRRSLLFGLYQKMA
jgi:hypothetical protein